VDKFVKENKKAALDAAFLRCGYCRKRLIIVIKKPQNAVFDFEKRNFPFNVENSQNKWSG